MNTQVFPQKPPIYLAKPIHPSKKPITLSPTILLPNTNKQTVLSATAKGFTGTIKDPTKLSKPTPNNNKNEDEEEIPQEVFERMMVRIVVSVGVPMALGLASLHFFGVVKEQHLWDVPVWIPFMTTLLTFGTSAFGIAYGALSTSLDIDKKGSFLGIEEAQQNWVEMWKEEDESKKKDV